MCEVGNTIELVRAVSRDQNYNKLIAIPKVFRRAKAKKTYCKDFTLKN